MQYATLREKIAAESAARRQRYQDFASLYERAHDAGMAAGNAAVPTPMIVGQPSTPFGSDVDHSKPTYYVEDGVCGFAWINVRPATCSFAKWLVKEGKTKSKSYYGGVDIWVPYFNQSMQRKEAYAEAFTNVLVQGGISASARSRMD